MKDDQFTPIHQQISEGTLIANPTGERQSLDSHRLARQPCTDESVSDAIPSDPEPTMEHLGRVRSVNHSWTCDEYPCVGSYTDGG